MSGRMLWCIFVVLFSLLSLWVAVKADREAVRRCEAGEIECRLPAEEPDRE